MSEGRSHRFCEFDSSVYPFSDLLCQHLGVPSLEQVHRDFDYAIEARTNDHSTPLHKAMYAIGPEFYSIYRMFVKNEIEPLFGESLVVQTRPNFRFQMPGSLGVTTWHRDSEMGHGPTETNVWLPLTEVSDTNCLWLESSPGLGDFSPVRTRKDTALVFDGARLRHGNVLSLSNYTRVSIDFRVIRRAEYSDRATRSVNMKQRFMLGEYFSALA
jgi:hypothetical protein